MGKGIFPLYAFNRGEVSRLALGRTDLDRLRLAAEEQINWLPLVLGPMTLRPGLKHLGSTRNNLQSWFVPFVFGNDDKAALELTSGQMRVWVPSHDAASANVYATGATGAVKEATIEAAEDGDLEVIIRPRVATEVVAGNFSSSQDWDFDATDGCTSERSASGKLVLTATARGGLASAHKKVTVKNQNVEHAFRIVVDRGPVTFRAGATKGGANFDSYIETTKLGTGEHSLAFTPTGQEVHIYFESSDTADRIVDSITIEAEGALTFSGVHCPWTTTDLPNVRHAQSGDIVFVACKGVHPYKIERRSTRSWSLVKYQPEKGPMRPVASADMTMTPGAMYGNTTLTSGREYFTEDHVGCLFRLFSDGQANKAVLGAADVYTDPIRITGVTGSDRKFAFNVTGLQKGTRLELQRSTEDGENGIGFKRVFGGIDRNKNYDYNDLAKTGVNANENSDPGSGNFTNVIAYYRVGIEGAYRGGAPTIDFREGQGTHHLSGGGVGYCRVTSIDGPKQARIEILKPFSSLEATKDWQEGEWSAANGYPSSVGFHDGRLWWAGGDKIWGSVSDDYANFDIDMEGDAGPISRSVGFGPVDNINWILPLTRLILGRDEAETSIRSSSFDEPITPHQLHPEGLLDQGHRTDRRVEMRHPRGVRLEIGAESLRADARHAGRGLCGA